MERDGRGTVFSQVSPPGVGGEGLIKAALHCFTAIRCSFLPRHQFRCETEANEGCFSLINLLLREDTQQRAQISWWTRGGGGGGDGLGPSIGLGAGSIQTDEAPSRSDSSKRPDVRPFAV